MFADPDVLILDEPTRGIDVGAKYEIYTIINELAAQGKAIIVISSELPELLGICDRIYALSAGRITGEVDTPRGPPREAHAVHDQGEGIAAMSADHSRPRPNPVIPPPQDESSGGVLGFLAGRLRQIGIFIALIAIVILFQVLTGGTLLTPRNVTSIINQNAYVLILAIGMVMIIIAGHIDLSVGSVVAFVGAMSGIFIVNWGWPWWVGVLGRGRWSAA